MRVCVTTEQRFALSPDGKMWSMGGPPYAFWSRYLRIFEEVRVIGRIQDIEKPDPGWPQVDGPGLEFQRIPYYVGPLGYARQFPEVRRALRQAVPPEDAAVLRVASTLANSLGPSFRGGRPFGLEVVCDPYDVYAPGSVEHPLRPFWRWWFTRHLRRQCRDASAVAYVTGETLQKRYSPSPTAYCTSYSSIELPEEAFAEGLRVPPPPGSPVRLVSIGSMEQMYKGFDDLIDAVAECAAAGCRLELALIGEGRYRPALEQRARDRRIEAQVRFLGQLPPGRPVRTQLDRADLFILPSKTEGLPRAMIEAMARGLPCLGTAVGGIPELLPPPDLVAKGDPRMLARRIQDVLADPARLRRMSAANLEKARGYNDSILSVRRDNFLRSIRQATADWNAKGRRRSNQEGREAGLTAPRVSTRSPAAP